MCADFRRDILYDHDFSEVFLYQIVKGSERISHLFPFPQQFIQDLAVGAGGAVEQDDGAGVDASEQFIEGFLMGGLFILIPVDIGKAPEEGVISHVFGHLEVFGAVFTLRRPVISGHGLSGDILVELFYVSQLLFKCFFCRDR